MHLVATHMIGAISKTTMTAGLQPTEVPDLSLIQQFSGLEESDMFPCGGQSRDDLDFGRSFVDPTSSTKLGPKIGFRRSLPHRAFLD